jgi:hypothetical protein
MEYLRNIFNKHKKFIINFFAVLFGFLIAFILNYKSSKKQALMLIWNDNCFHIHHWISYGIILLAMLFHKFFPMEIDYIVIFFIVGLILEDFLYRDIFQVREKCKKMCNFVNK